MACDMKSIGIFFKYSLNRQRGLENAIEDINKDSDVYLLPFARSCLGAVLTSSDHVLSAFAQGFICVAVQLLSTF